MPSVEGIQFGQLVTAASIILLVIAAYNAIMSAIKTHRGEKMLKSKPVEDLKAKVETHDAILARDKARLDNMEEQQIILLRSVRAILSHEINGNSIDKMQQSTSEIEEYLIRRKSNV